MKYLLSLVLALLVYSCCKDKIPPCGPCEGLDAVIISSPTENVFVDALSETFENGMPIDTFETVVDKEDGKYYLVREGHDAAKKNCQISRTPLEHDAEGYLYMRRAGSSESCIGRGCSHCSFKSGGGCECIGSTNSCDHVITRNSAIFKK